MKKLLDLFFILSLALSYVIVYDLAKLRSDNEYKIEMELRDIQMQSFIKGRHK